MVRHFTLILGALDLDKESINNDSYLPSLHITRVTFLINELINIVQFPNKEIYNMNE